MRCLRVLGLLCSIVLLGTAYAYSPDFECAAQRYGFPAWRGVTKTAYSRTLGSFELPSLPLQTNSPAIGVAFTDDGGYWRLQLNNGNSEMLRVVKMVATNVVQAQEFLVKCMAGFEVDCSSSTNDIGDRGYGAVLRYKDFAAFSRNNVFVYVSSTTNAYSAASLARQIDANILWKSTGFGDLMWFVGGLICVVLLLSVMLIRNKKTRFVSGNSFGKNGFGVLRGRHSAKQRMELE